MKKVWLVVALIACVASGFVVLQVIRYYSGGELERHVKQLRAEKEPKATRQRQAGSPKASTKKATARKRAQPTTRAHPINLEQFYRNIELTLLQRAYAEKVVAALAEQQSWLRQQLSSLRTKTEQTLLQCIADEKKAGISSAELRKMPLAKAYEEKILPNVEPRKRHQAEQVYEQFSSKSKELRSTLRQSRQLANKMLLSLLSKEQKAIYHREHPRKPPATTKAEKK